MRDSGGGGTSWDAADYTYQSEIQELLTLFQQKYVKAKENEAASANGPGGGLINNANREAYEEEGDLSSYLTPFTEPKATELFVDYIRYAYRPGEDAPQVASDDAKIPLEDIEDTVQDNWAGTAGDNFQQNYIHDSVVPAIRDQERLGYALFCLADAHRRAVHAMREDSKRILRKAIEALEDLPLQQATTILKLQEVIISSALSAGGGALEAIYSAANLAKQSAKISIGATVARNVRSETVSELTSLKGRAAARAAGIGRGLDELIEKCADGGLVPIKPDVSKKTFDPADFQLEDGIKRQV